MSKLGKKMSMRAKILIANFAMIFTLTIHSAIEMKLAANDATASVLEEFEGYASQIGEAIAAQFFERYGDVQAFALNPALTAEDHAVTNEYLNRYASLYGIYDVILLVDTEGRYVASNTLSPSGQPIDLDRIKNLDFSGASWFRAVMNGQFTEDKDRGYQGTFFEDAQIDPISSAVYGTPIFGTSFSAPVKDKDGKVVGVLSNRANFSWVEGEFKSFNRSLNKLGLHETEFALINQKGDLILQYDPDEKVHSDFARDFNKLLKVNLVAEGFTPAKELVGGRSGHSFEHNPLKKVEQAVGYNYMDSPKWISKIGWGILVRDIPSELLADVQDMQQEFYIGSLVFMLLFMGIGWWTTSGISKQFIAVSDKLREAAEMTSQTANRLTESSQTVAASSAEQSAAVQETVSSMSEISSMIAQTTQNTKDCTEIASRVSGKSEQGNQVMRRLATAMDAVHHANGQLQNMAHIINEVSAKTMVINDIVFKTQLLSINASIEAARAGQHGKGFSVVAEEVGNLAQMSGNAAKEIQNLIADSQKQVAQIIEITQARTQESKSVSEEALTAFTDIAGGIQAINERLQGVAQATREQEIGIQQINIAMGHMDQTTQRNSAVATEANALAQELGKQSERTYRVMRAFRTLVLGPESERLSAKEDIIDSIIGDRAPQAAAAQAAARAEEGGDKADGQLQLASQKILQRIGGEGANHGHSGPGAEKGLGADPGVDANDPGFRKAV